MRNAPVVHERLGQRLALLATCLMGFSLFLNLYFTQIILGPIAQVFGTTVLAARYTMVAATAGVVFAPIFAGRLPQRKTIQIASLAAMAISAGVESAAPELWVLIGTRFCQGVLVGMLFIQAMGRIATIHRVHFGAISNGLFVSSTTLGGFTSRFLPPYLVDGAGLKATFLVLALALLLICAAVLVSPLPAVATDATRQPPPLAVQASGRRRSFVTEYLMGFCVLFSQASIYTYLPVRLAHAPFFLSSRQIAFTAFVFLLGAVSAPLTIRVTRNDLSRSAISLFFACVAVGALMTGLSSLRAVIFGLALFSIGAFAQQAMLSRRLTARAGAATPRIFAGYMSVYYLGGSVGSYLSGDVFVAHGFPAVALLVVSIAVLGGTALHLEKAWHPAVTRQVLVTGGSPLTTDPRNSEAEP